MASPPRNMQARGPKSSGGGSPPTRGRGMTPPAAMSRVTQALAPNARVQPTVERKVGRQLPDGYSGGDR